MCESILLLRCNLIDITNRYEVFSFSKIETEERVFTVTLEQRTVVKYKQKEELRVVVNTVTNSFKIGIGLSVYSFAPKSP